MAQYVSWSEGMWLLKNNDDSWKQVYLGEAGNYAYPETCQIFAVRMGDSVLVTCKGITKRSEQDHIISADCTVKGFAEAKNGKTLRELMAEEVLYNYFLEPDGCKRYDV
jgi:hypothetical protein